MNSLRRRDTFVLVPVLAMLAGQDCSVDEFERIAVFLMGQTLQDWEWLHGSGAEVKGLINVGWAVMELPRRPCAMRAIALEESVWLQLDRPKARWLELMDGVNGTDWSRGGHSLPSGEAFIALNDQPHCDPRASVVHASRLRGGRKRKLLLVAWLESGEWDCRNGSDLTYPAHQGWYLSVVASLASEHRWLVQWSVFRWTAHFRWQRLLARYWHLPHILERCARAMYVAQVFGIHRPWNQVWSK
ncbi:hypothetical protein [Pseudomonas sp. OTU5201]|uniref:hypothetical protein n=1 Tax=Pseudomonas sp. OTU5201 TaxID=3043850 RepID=UPI00313B7023